MPHLNKRGRIYCHYLVCIHSHVNRILITHSYLYHVEVWRNVACFSKFHRQPRFPVLEKLPLSPFNPYPHFHEGTEVMPYVVCVLRIWESYEDIEEAQATRAKKDAMKGKGKRGQKRN
jgi:hypothetical protein